MNSRRFLGSALSRRSAPDFGLLIADHRPLTTHHSLLHSWSPTFKLWTSDSRLQTQDSPPGLRISTFTPFCILHSTFYILHSIFAPLPSAAMILSCHEFCTRNDRRDACATLTSDLRPLCVTLDIGHWTLDFPPHLPEAGHAVFDAAGHRPQPLTGHESGQVEFDSGMAESLPPRLLLALLAGTFAHWFLGPGVPLPGTLAALVWLAMAGCPVHARFDFPFRVHSIATVFLLYCGVLSCSSRTQE